MRFAITGLAAACLLAFAPSASEAARADGPRQSAKASQQSRAPVAAARPAATRPAAATPARAAPRQAAATPRQASRAQAASPPAGSRNLAAQARSPRGSKGARVAAVAPRRGSAAVAPVPYARHHAAPNTLRQTAMASCTFRNGRRVCGPVMRTVSFRWSQGGGMPAPTLAQTTCPDGTIATTAIGHSDVVRCVPL